MVLRSQPAYISLTARRAQPAGPPPTQPTTHPNDTNANARNPQFPLDKPRSISVSRYTARGDRHRQHDHKENTTHPPALPLSTSTRHDQSMRASNQRSQLASLQPAA